MIFDLAEDFSGGRAAVIAGTWKANTLSGKWGFIDRDGTFVTPHAFDRCRAYSEGRAAVAKGRRWSFIDDAGTTVGTLDFDEAWWFAEGRALVRDGASYAYVDRDGALAIPFRPERRRASHFAEGLAVVAEDERWGYVDTSGAWVIAPTLAYGLDFHDGLAAARDGDAWGFLDRAGAWVIPPSFGEVLPMCRGRAFVRGKDRDPWHLVDRGGASLGGEIWDEVTPFHEGRAAVRRGERWGYIDEDGAIAIPPRFVTAEPFHEGFAIVHDGRACFVDRDGRPLRTEGSDRLLSARRFAEGLAPIQIDDGRRARWGFVTKSGALHTPPLFDRASSFSEGLAVVELDRKLGYFRPDGDLLAPGRPPET